MKYIVIVPDGMCDRPLEALGGKTPLEVCNIPNIAKMAMRGIVGKVNNVPPGMQPGSDVANLSLLGYNPKEFYTGRGPFEAQSLGIKLKDTEMAFRCNLVTEKDGRMFDYSSGHISNKESACLIKFLDKKLGSKYVKFYPGMSYRHILVVDVKKTNVNLKDLKCWPPHDISGQTIEDHLPLGEDQELFRGLMLKSKDLLSSHKVNNIRRQENKNIANMIWLWGGGFKPGVKNFKQKFHLTGSMISAVGLLNGIAMAMGLKSVAVPGITGYYDTDYSAKARYGINALKKTDFLFIHVEAPDEAGHNGHLEEKIKAMENIDKKIVGPILDAIEGKYKFRMLVCPDHPTPIAVRTHTIDPVPFVMYGEGIHPNGIDEYSEKSLSRADIKDYGQGHKMIEEFLLQAEIY